jgi:RimJ/RimL family protein N-acetyltransferase
MNCGQRKTCSPSDYQSSGKSMTVSGKIQLRNKRLSDAANDYAWQSDFELARLDAASTLSVNFAQYLAEYAFELRLSPSRYDYWFAVDTLDGKHIGNCGYYHVDSVNKEAELGIMIGDRDYWDKGYGADTVSAMLDYLFNKKDFQRIYLKTLESNHRAQRCFQKCGFTPCGSMTRNGHYFMLMEMKRKQWEERDKTQGQLSVEE